MSKVLGLCFILSDFMLQGRVLKSAFSSVEVAVDSGLLKVESCKKDVLELARLIEDEANKERHTDQLSQVSLRLMCWLFL